MIRDELLLYLKTLARTHNVNGKLHNKEMKKNTQHIDHVSKMLFSFVQFCWTSSVNFMENAHVYV